MSKANKSARDKVVGGVNWWDYLNSIKPKGFRNTPQYLDYNQILNRAEEMKSVNKTIKNRKKQEKKLLKFAKHNAKHKTRLDKTMNDVDNKKQTKMDKVAGQIRYGFALAKWMGLQHEQ